MIFTSPHPDIDIPDDIALPDYIFEHRHRYADKPALVDGLSGRGMSFGQLELSSRAFARGLHRKGFAKRDVFAIYCPNLPEYAVVFLGVALLGGINTTINPLYTIDELAWQLNDTNARFLITTPLFYDNAVRAASQSAIEEVFVLGADTDEMSTYESLLEAEGELPRVAIDPVRDVVVLPYSGEPPACPRESC